MVHQQVLPRAKVEQRPVALVTAPPTALTDTTRNENVFCSMLLQVLLPHPRDGRAAR